MSFSEDQNLAPLKLIFQEWKNQCQTQKAVKCRFFTLWKEEIAKKK